MCTIHNSLAKKQTFKGDNHKSDSHSLTRDWHTYANILKVPANFFYVHGTIKGHPATSEEPAARRYVTVSSSVSRKPTTLNATVKKKYELLKTNLRSG